MKRATSLLLSAALTLSLVAPAAAAEPGGYSDTSEHWGKAAIETWSGHGILKGYEDGSFRPEATITRSELAAVLDRVMGYQTTVENTFADVAPDAWYTTNILHLAAQGIFTGDHEGMKPEEDITRQEAYTALARALQVEPSDKAAGFSDDAATSDWAKGYLSAMKAAGYIEGTDGGAIRPTGPITRAEVVSVLDRMAPGFVNADGEYSADCAGNLIVNAQNVTLKDMTISGDLIVADGVGNGDVSLDNVTVKGAVILRGCGENSFHIKPGTVVGTVIVTKTTDGRIRLVNESGKTIPMVYVNDGVDGVTLEGDLTSVVVACDTPVKLGEGKVDSLSVAAPGAQVSVSRDAEVKRLDVGEAAKGAELDVKGTVKDLVAGAEAKITNSGTITNVKASANGVVLDGTKPKHVSTTSGVTPPKDSSGSTVNGSIGGGGGSSSSSDDSSVNTTTTVSTVNLQLLAPVFGAKPDTADVMGVGYTAVTKWLNGDGTDTTEADYRLDGGFTTKHIYKAEVTLTPSSGYVFADAAGLTVNVNDGNGTDHTPVSVTNSGTKRVVTLQFAETADKKPVENVHVQGDAVIGFTKTGTLSVEFFDNKLKTGFTYQWYTVDSDGGNLEEISGETGTTYQITAGSEAKVEYYRCVVSVDGEEYESNVFEVTIRDLLDPSSVPAPIFVASEKEKIKVGQDYRGANAAVTFELDAASLKKHDDLTYLISVTLFEYEESSTPLSRSVEVTVPSADLYDNPVVEVSIPLLDCIFRRLQFNQEGYYYSPENIGATMAKISITPIVSGIPLSEVSHNVIDHSWGYVTLVRSVLGNGPDNPYTGDDNAFIEGARPDSAEVTVDTKAYSITVTGLGEGSGGVFVVAWDQGQPRAMLYAHEQNNMGTAVVYVGGIIDKPKPLLLPSGGMLRVEFPEFFGGDTYLWSNIVAGSSNIGDGTATVLIVKYSENGSCYVIAAKEAKQIVFDPGDNT